MQIINYCDLSCLQKMNEINWHSLYRRPSLFTELVFAVLTICGPENGGKSRRKIYKLKPKMAVLVFADPNFSGT